MTQLDDLHALRVAYFGSDVASAFFAAEEKINRQLLELMRVEKDQNMTIEEKAERAQQKLTSMPELAAAYESNRKAADDPPVILRITSCQYLDTASCK